MIGRGRSAGLVVGIVLIAAAARAGEGPPPPPTITVEGEASDTFEADKAILALGVVTERPRAIDAAGDNGKAVTAVIDAVKREGIEPRAIQSTSVSLEPVYTERQDGSQAITAFRASNHLEVSVTPPDRAGLLAGSLIEKGVNTIDGITFTSEANARRADALRGEAVRDARRKAESYVAALGLRLGRVLGISPQGSPVRPVFARAGRAMKADAPTVPLESGQLTASQAVSVTWEIVER